MSGIKVSKSGEPIWRESEAGYTNRAIAIALEPLSVVVRLKGTRKQLRVPIAWVYLKACEMEAASVRVKRKPKIRRGEFALQ